MREKEIRRRPFLEVVHAHSSPDANSQTPNHELRGVLGETGRAVRNSVQPERGMILLEQLRHFALQYVTMRSTLECYGISVKGMPDWDRVACAFTPNLLEVSFNLQDPALIIVPPISRNLMITAINGQLVRGQQMSVVRSWENDDFWNRGMPERNRHWRAAIAEAAPNVKLDDEPSGTDFEICKQLARHYLGTGSTIINDATTYLALAMRAVHDGHPVDTDTVTVLNALNMTEDGGVAQAGWQEDGINMDVVKPRNLGHVLTDNQHLRVRGLLNLNLK